MSELVNAFLKRSLKFEANAKWNIEQGDYDLVVFHVEQAIQLLLKARLLELAGEYPKTHNLVTLIEIIYRITGEEKYRDFLRKNRVRLAKIMDAYIASRYLARDFYEEEAVEALALLRELRDLLGGKNV